MLLAALGGGIGNSIGAILDQPSICCVSLICLTRLKSWYSGDPSHLCTKVPLWTSGSPRFNQKMIPPISASSPPLRVPINTHQYPELASLFSRSVCSLEPSVSACSTSSDSFNTFDDLFELGRAARPGLEDSASYEATSSTCFFLFANTAATFSTLRLGMAADDELEATGEGSKSLMDFGGSVLGILKLDHKVSSSARGCSVYSCLVLSC
jgi:hypothetical protein